MALALPATWAGAQAFPSKPVTIVVPFPAGGALDTVARGIAGYLIDGPEEIDPAWLQGKQRIGVTAGASAPEILVKRVVDRIRELTGAEVGQLAGVAEGVSFPLPKGLA
mgnify:CR=1 FL=1